MKPILILLFSLLLAWHPADSRARDALRVDSIAIPVSDLDRAVHTAITVSDNAASLRYYRDLLGMHVAGTSENYGPEQEHLNNVFGAHLAITALRGAAHASEISGQLFPADPDLFGFSRAFTLRDPDGHAAAIGLGQP